MGFGAKFLGVPSLGHESTDLAGALFTSRLASSSARWTVTGTWRWRRKNLSIRSLWVMCEMDSAAGVANYRSTCGYGGEVLYRMN